MMVAPTGSHSRPVMLLPGLSAWRHCHCAVHRWNARFQLGSACGVYGGRSVSLLLQPWLKASWWKGWCVPPAPASHSNRRGGLRTDQSDAWPTELLQSDFYLGVCLRDWSVEQGAMEWPLGRVISFSDARTR